MRKRNKDTLRVDTRMRRLVRHLREWRALHGRVVHDQVLRGVAYGVGSGAVSLLVVWFEARH